MVYSEMKEFEEIKKLVQNEKNIFLLGCNGCAEVVQTGGMKVLLEAKDKLEKEGKNISGLLNIDFLCSKTLIRKRITRHFDEIEKSDCIIVFSCGIGVQCAGTVIKKPVYSATNTTFLGGFQGIWFGGERCAECGTCYLGITGGICPITFCAKELVNGACGGAKDGKCEINTGKDCGWVLIYNKLKETGRLKNLKEFQSPRDFKKIEPTEKLRKDIHFAIDE